MKSKVFESVAPIAVNRCVIFNTDADSYHGHPEPLTTPDGVLQTIGGALLLHGVEGRSTKRCRITRPCTRLERPTGMTRASAREAAALRREQHLAQWVPPLGVALLAGHHASCEKGGRGQGLRPLAVADTLAGLALPCGKKIQAPEGWVGEGRFATLRPLHLPERSAWLA